MNPNNYCALDIETVGGQWVNFPDGFELLMTGIRYLNEYTVYTAEPDSLKSMASFLNSFDGVTVTYNGNFFDIPILNLYCKNVLDQELSLARHYDLLEEIKKKAGRRISLDDVASFSFGAHKVPWDHKNNRNVWANEPQLLIDYNKVVLDLTAELYERVLKVEQIFLSNATIVLPVPDGNEEFSAGNSD